MLHLGGAGPPRGWRSHRDPNGDPVDEGAAFCSRCRTSLLLPMGRTATPIAAESNEAGDSSGKPADGQDASECPLSRKPLAEHRHPLLHIQDNLRTYLVPQVCALSLWDDARSLALG